MPSIENKIYYYPYYCYRHFPSLEDGLVEILNGIIMFGKIEIYQNLDNAIKAGEEMLCDDDTYGILVIDLTHGFPRVDEYPRKQPWTGKNITHDFIKFLKIED